MFGVHFFQEKSSHTKRSFVGLEAELQIKRNHSKRTIREDPLYSLQWHLQHVEQPANASGKGVTIAIVDDGLQHTHPEIQANYDAAHSYDFNGGDNDPAPQNGEDGHGTAAAAVAIAVKNNGHCGRGVAPEASVIGFRLIAEPVDDVTEALALTKWPDLVDIYSNSWGPYDSGHGMDRPGMVVRRALAYATKTGRHGKGSIYVWAAGNGRHTHDSCAFDGYAGSPYVNAIGALDYDGNQSWYSEGCSNLLAVAPSSGSPDRGIVTADLLGPSGYDPTECTRDFGGTSSAAPLAAGIIALMLQARPELTWRDVRHVIALGATKIDISSLPKSSLSVTNGGGYTHSNSFGFGLLKIPALMQTLRNYTQVAAVQKQFTTDRLVINKPISTSVGVTFNVTLSFIESVIVRVNLIHPRRGDLLITITSPFNTTSVLAEVRRNDDHADYNFDDGWAFSSLTFWGESLGLASKWFINVTDTESDGRGTLKWIQVAVFGF